MRVYRELSVSFLPALLLASASAMAATAGADARAAMAGAAAPLRAISAQNIGTQVRFLASDLLEGRGTGARGGDIAAEYIATQFALDGLQPAGDNGGYLQKVDFIGLTPRGGQDHAQLLPTQGAAMDQLLGDDYVVNDETGATASDGDAPVV